MITATREPFTDYLKTQLHLENHELPEAGAWSNVGNTTGALALRLNLLSVDQIDRILEIQENDGQGRMFGELAVELGFVTEDEIVRLLEVQQLNKYLELGEQLVLSGKTDIATLLTNLRDFQLDATR